MHSSRIRTARCGRCTAGEGSRDRDLPLQRTPARTEISSQPRQRPPRGQKNPPQPEHRPPGQRPSPQDRDPLLVNRHTWGKQYLPAPSLAGGKNGHTTHIQQHHKKSSKRSHWLIEVFCGQKTFPQWKSLQNTDRSENWRRGFRFV